MGYTHYWDQKTFDIDEAVIADVRKLCDASSVTVTDYAGRPGSEPEITTSLIHLNAQKPDMGESLRLVGRSSEIGDAEFEFCKPCGEAYDALVTAILIRVAETNPDTKIRSDGVFETDWRAGRELFESTLHRKASCHSGVARRLSIFTSKQWGDAYLHEYRDYSSIYAYGDPRTRYGSTHRSIDFDTMEAASEWLRDGGYRGVTFAEYYAGR